jgi:hypothetical protein
MAAVVAIADEMLERIIGRSRYPVAPLLGEDMVGWIMLRSTKW